MFKSTRKSAAFLALSAAVCVTPLSADAGLLYYNDGTVNDFGETFGDVAFNVPFNEVYGPGGFLDGSPDDIPPYNTNTNAGLVTFQGAAGGVAGGGFRLQVDVPAGDVAQKGVAFFPYGSVADRKDPAGAQWQARFKKLAESLGVSTKEAIDIWRDEGIANNQGTLFKLVRYVGDPLVSVPPTDLSVLDLDPLSAEAVAAALQDDNVLPIFWEVTGERQLDTLDILFGDYGLNTGYADVQHHFPYLAVLDGVGPEDFGISRESAGIIQFNGDALTGEDSFVGSFALSVADPVDIPAPGTLSLLLAGSVILVRRPRLWHNSTFVSC